MAEIVPNYYQGATLGAYELVELLGEEGDYIELVGIGASARSISEGYDSVLRQYPRLKKIPAPSAIWSPEEAFRIIIDTIQRDPNLKGVISGNYQLALAAKEALQATGKTKIIVVAVGGIPDCGQPSGQHGINAIARRFSRRLQCWFTGIVGCF